MKSRLALQLRTFLSPILCIVTYALYGQSLDQQVVGSAGSLSTTMAGSLHWTMGESFVQDYNTPQMLWCEGFHQVKTEIATTLDVQPFYGNKKLNELRAYPNPASNVVHIETTQATRTSIYDFSGKPLYTSSVYTPSTTIYFDGIPDGLYIIKAVNERNQVIGNTKIIHLKE